MSLSSVGATSPLQQLQAVFQSADTNGDGQLSSDEFAALGKNLQGAGSNSTVSITLNVTSPSQNFSSDTLASLLGLQQSQGTGGTQGAHHHHHGGAAKLFSAADANGDGQVSADELTTALQAHAPAGATGAQDPAAIAAQMIKDGDTDGNGTLSLNEMKAMKPHGGPHGPPPAEGASAPSASASSASSSSQPSYDPADTNKDGTVSADELIAALQSAASGSGAQATASNSFNLLSQLLSKLTDGATASSQTSAVMA